MNIIILGPQGSGKGTQARLIAEKFGFNYFESGAYLRRISESNSEVKKMLDQGKFVPDKEMTSYLTAYLDQENLYDNIVFEGFPRNTEQYNFLKSWLADRGVIINLAIVLMISEEESIRRLSARRQDPETGKIYNLITDPPPEDIDKSRLVKRDDDEPAAIAKRLELYKKLTQPLIQALKKDTEVVEINGERPIDEIHKEIVNLIEK